MTDAIEHPTAKTINEMMSRFENADLEGLLDYWSDDAVMHVPGKSPLGGHYRGRDEIRNAILEFGRVSHGTLKLETLDVLAADRHGVGVFRATAERDGKRLDVTDATAFKVDGQGKFSECWWLPDDQAAFDDFWS